MLSGESAPGNPPEAVADTCEDVLNTEFKGVRLGAKNLPLLACCPPASKHGQVVAHRVKVSTQVSLRGLRAASGPEFFELRQAPWPQRRTPGPV